MGGLGFTGTEKDLGFQVLVLLVPALLHVEPGLVGGRTADDVLMKALRLVEQDIEAELSAARVAGVALVVQVHAVFPCQHRAQLIHQKVEKAGRTAHGAIRHGGKHCPHL